MDGDSLAVVPAVLGRLIVVGSSDRTRRGELAGDGRGMGRSGVVIKSGEVRVGRCALMGYLGVEREEGEGAVEGRDFFLRTARGGDDSWFVGDVGKAATAVLGLVAGTVTKFCLFETIGEALPRRCSLAAVSAGEELLALADAKMVMLWRIEEGGGGGGG